jgi:allantoate deiminase
LTRTFCSPAMRKANDLVAGWMREAGLQTSEDAIGNLIGLCPGRDEFVQTLLLGSHLDTVRAAGKYDGPLGVLIAIACMQYFKDQEANLPFAVEVIGFGDEEGVRYQTTFLGSKAFIGQLTEVDLKRVDANGVTMADAIKAFGGKPEEIKNLRRETHKILAYAEVHIEQGPVLERKLQPVGVVTAISGQSRIKAGFTGQAGHAGTTPMALRHDALAAAAEFITAVESCAKARAGLVATVGQIEALPGATNVIPGEVNLSVDVRHPQDASRQEACAFLQETALRIGEKRGTPVTWEVMQDVHSVSCSRELSLLLGKAARKQLLEVTELPSGAGHDAAMLGEIAPIAMLFVRCKGGISHHPDESVMVEDVAVAIEVMIDFFEMLANQLNPITKRKHA